MSDLGSTIDAIKSKTMTRMGKAVEDLAHTMAGIRTGRASISLLDGVKVDYYSTPTPLNQLSTLHVPEPSLITAQPWDVAAGILIAVEAGAVVTDTDGGRFRLNRPWFAAAATAALNRELVHVLGEK